jgi:ParB/RepB/Spo0J family partition protein
MKGQQTNMQQPTATADFQTLAIDQLRESPTNPRRTFDEAKLQELAQSIRAQGILVPLIVREIEHEMFEVVAGARRFRAAQQAELFTLPVRVVELTNAEALELQLIENAIREDVHPYEEAMAYKALLETSEPRYDVASIALKAATRRRFAHLRIGAPRRQLPGSLSESMHGSLLASAEVHRRDPQPTPTLAARTPRGSFTPAPLAGWCSTTVELRKSAHPLVRCVDLREPRSNGTARGGRRDNASWRQREKCDLL